MSVILPMKLVPNPATPTMFKLASFQEIFIRDIYGLKRVPETPYEIARRYTRDYLLGEDSE
jgi:hypothetical protein